MRITVLAITALLTFGVAIPSFAQTEKLTPGIEMPAADVALRNIDGKSITLKSAMGKNGLLVMFSCNTCPFVVKNQSTTLKTISYAREHNIGMVIINSNEAKRGDDDSYKEMAKYAQKQGYTVPYLADDNSTVADKFGANHTPEIFLFNSAGKLVYMGAMSDNPGDPTSATKMYINDAIDALLAGKVPNPATTKSIGCSIKRKA